MTHLLEAKVWEMIQETMLDPKKLGDCMDAPRAARRGDQGVANRLSRIARHVARIEDQRRRLIEHYAMDRLPSKEYIDANRALDEKLARLKREKAEIAADIGDAHASPEAGQFCERARQRSEACADFDAKRQFLAEHIERIIYNHYKVTVVGTIPLSESTQPESDRTEPKGAAFRIDGEIDPHLTRRYTRAPS